MLKKVAVKRNIKTEDMLRFIPFSERKKVTDIARKLKSVKIAHINATAEGGGVAELLLSIIPYLKTLGVEAEWHSLTSEVGEKFFKITNKIHDALQGSPLKISQSKWKEYERIGNLLSKEIEKINCDILVINDPQPLMAGTLTNTKTKKIYISHIDTSSAQKAVLQKIAPYLSPYQKIIFSNKVFIHKSLFNKKISIIPPAIDPLSPKQKIVSKSQARIYLKKHAGIDIENPLIVQASRFDVWKNPLGVVKAMEIVRKKIPKAQLALVGFEKAKDNPAARGVYLQIKKIAGKTPGVFLFFDPTDKDIETFTVMAQNGADVIVQNSIKEGFGLTVTEAMWKSQPVIGGPAAGIKLQIKNGKNGFIVKKPKELAEKILWLLNNPDKKEKMGQEAKKSVAKKFLMGRLVFDHLKLYNSI